MREWLENIAGPAYATAMLWTLGALAMLLVVLLLIKIVRNLTFGTFVAGGRQRKARLAVMDAAAVDSHRRLVLVRRDDVEHLLLIGGPTDVVVEQNIRLAAPARRPPAEEHGFEPAAQPAAEPPRPVMPAPLAAPAAAVAPTGSQVARPQPAAAPASPLRAPPSPVTPRPAATPLRPVAPAPVARPAATGPEQASSTPTAASLDDALRAELEQTLDATPKAEPQLPPSVEDEMSKLLGELSRTKR